MRADLQERLFKKYPKLFRQVDLPVEQSLMSFGIECGDGWYELIDDLCSKLQHYDVEAVQVKEKFGTLRFYLDYYPEGVDQLVEEAEERSSTICEYCGKSGRTVNIGNWLYTVCEECKRKKEREIYD